jgi:integrase
MPKIKLTQRVIARIEAPQPGGKPVLFWDLDLKGFGVLASGKTNVKSFIAQRDLPNGKTRRITIAAVVEMTLTKAREHAAAILVDMRRGIDPKAARRGVATLKQTLDTYLAACKDLRPSTVRSYRRAVEDYLKDWADLPLRDISADMVEACHHRIGAQIGEATANNVMRTFRALHNFAAERIADLPPNPVERRLRRQWFAVAARTRMVRFEQLPAFYRAVSELPSPVARDYLLLLLFTGLRRSEVASLTWTDIDLVGRLIRIPGSRTKSGRKLDLPMSSLVHDLLVARRSQSRSNYVFDADSKSGHLEEPKFALAMVAEASGIAISCHDLRRTFATVAEHSEVSPLALKAMLNHSVGKGDVTQQYIQLSAEQLRGPVQKVCNKLMELCAMLSAVGGKVAKIR